MCQPVLVLNHLQLALGTHVTVMVAMFNGAGHVVCGPLGIEVGVCSALVLTFAEVTMHRKLLLSGC